MGQPAKKPRRLEREDLPDPFRELVSILASLRGDPGCPWDKEQTHQTLVPYLVEEAYEVIEAIEAGSPPRLREELGDLLLQIVFHAQISREAGDFTIDEVCRSIVEKMVRRHPHVFGKARVANAQEVVVQWEEIKLREKGGSPRTSLMDGIPGILPALLQAARVQNRAAEVGFDWDQVEGPLEKYREEIDELSHAARTGDRKRVLEEYGDVLFSLVALGRHLQVDAEEALRAASRRFVQRFQNMEARGREQGKSLSVMEPAELEALWEQAKQGRETSP